MNRAEFQVLYLPIGTPTFHRESAEAAFQSTASMLRRTACALTLSASAIRMPNGPLLSTDALDAFLDGSEPDLIILQNVTFASAAYISRVLARFNAPILLWSLREPEAEGGRLKLNSLTGAYAAANLLRSTGRTNFSFVLGGPDDNHTARQVTAVLRAAKCRGAICGAKLLCIGHPPEGFDFGRSDTAKLLQTFGLFQESIECRELMEKAGACEDEELYPYLAEAETKLRGFSSLPEKNRLGYARLMKAYNDVISLRGADALASRCWPDFFTQFGTPVCAVLSMLGDRGIPAACETDAMGAVSMLIGQALSGQPVFFGDPAAIDTKENAVIFWHCGMAAPSLAREPEGAQVGVHCNRSVGPTMDFGCRGGERATVFRVGREPEGGFRFFLGAGQILDRPKAYTGTSLTVRWDTDVEEMTWKSVMAGWEPHFAVLYGDWIPELTALADMHGIAAERY